MIIIPGYAAVLVCSEVPVELVIVTRVLPWFFTIKPPACVILIEFSGESLATKPTSPSFPNTYPSVGAAVTSESLAFTPNFHCGVEFASV